MGAPDAAGSQDADAGQVRQKHGGGHRGSRGSILGDGQCKITPAGFQNPLLSCQHFQLGIAQSDGWSTLEHGDRRWHAAFFAHDIFGLAGRFQVDWPR